MAPGEADRIAKGGSPGAVQRISAVAFAHSRHRRRPGLEPRVEAAREVGDVVAVPLEEGARVGRAHAGLAVAEDG